MTDNDWFHIAHDGRGATVIYIHGEISANAGPFFDALRDLPALKEVDLFVNSMGGDPNTAMSIHDKLRDLAGKGCTVRAHVEGIAASSAALIIAGADHVQINPDAFMMLHEPRYIDGREADARIEDAAEGMARRISKKLGRDRAEVRDLLREGKWFGAETAAALGFADAIGETRVGE